MSCISFITDKSCYRKDRKHQNPFKTIKIFNSKERNEKVAKCQDHCQSNDRCFYFSINLKTSKCSLHEDGDYENAENYYGAPKFCGKFYLCLIFSKVITI